jgi:hypothetical protein
MGTRSITFFYDDVDQKNEKPFVAVYTQFDGYVSGFGVEISNFLKNMKVVNGYTLQEEEGGFANGMGCLAAQFVCEVKNGIGNVYIVKSDTGTDNVDYVYHVYNNRVVVENLGYILFEGTWQEYNTFAEKT